MNPADFRAIFPEFGQTIYPDALVTFWLSVAAQMVNATRWGSLTNQGTALLTAHYLVLANEASQTSAAQVAASGMGTIGEVVGPETAKSVDGVSVSQDIASVTIPGAGTFNRTQYGVQYWQLAQMMGAGGMQINAC
jgi:hypothetical protein